MTLILGHFTDLVTLTITDAHTFKQFNISKCLLHHTIERCTMRAFSAVAELLVTVAYYAG